MCGIVGTIGLHSSPVENVLRSLAHRGPDGEGSVRIGPVWLGHRRLSIIDLTETGAQPMNKPGCGTIVFNGEIYDHETHRRGLERDGIRFDGRSDTEVLLRGLALRGPAFLSGLHGMYAFAWLEAAGTRLWLARDHAGMKPLYVWTGGGRLAFASEVRTIADAIRLVSGEVHPSGDALAQFLRWGSIPEPQTILDGVEMVPADTAIAFDAANAKVVTRERTSTVRPQAHGDAVAAVRDAVHAAVSRHLVADTRVALFLSGGIDSGVLASAAARAEGAKPTTITVVLGTRGTADEPAIARASSARLGLDLRLVSIEDWMKRLEGVLRAFDQPSVDGLNTFLISGVARELGFKVALSGVGADEVFGGYHFLHRRRGIVAKIPGWRFAARELGPALRHSRSAHARRVGSLLEGAAAGEPAQRSWRRIVPESIVQELIPHRAEIGRTDDVEDPLLLEQRTYLRDTLLRDADVMGMAHGVEIRAPFLDPQVLGVASGIGSEQILAPGRPPKWLLREAWARELQAETLRRPKTGFSLDVSRWLRGSGAENLRRAREGLAKQRFLAPRAVERMFKTWESRLEGTHPSAWVPLFTMVQIEEQFRRWGEPK